MFGAGPGLLASDALMLGIDPTCSATAWPRRSRSSCASSSGEIVTEKTEWYTLVNARAHLLPYTQAASGGGGGQRGHAVGRQAGRQVRPRHALCRRHQPAASTRSARTGRSPTRSPRSTAARWNPRGCGWSARCTSPRRAKRRSRTCRFGCERYLGYLNNNQPRIIVPAGQDAAEWFVENKFGVIGTPDDAIAMIQRLQDKAGRVRRVPAAGAQLGGLGGDQAILRALCPLRDATFLGRQHPARRVVQLVHRARDELTEKRTAAAVPCSTSTRRRCAPPARRLRSSGPRRGARPGDVPADVILVVFDHPAAAGALLNAAQRLAALSGASRINALLVRTLPEAMVSPSRKC